MNAVRDGAQGRGSRHAYVSVSKLSVACPVVQSAQVAVTEPPNTE